VREELSCGETRYSPARLDGGAGFSRTGFAEAKAPEPSLWTLHGVGISQASELPTSPLQASSYGDGADSEDGRDFSKRVSLYLLQQKYFPIDLRKLEGLQESLQKERFLSARGLPICNKIRHTCLEKSRSCIGFLRMVQEGAILLHGLNFSCESPGERLTSNPNVHASP